MLSIIVVAHNAVDLTRRCLEALSQAHISTDYEVLLVDNGSSDNLRCFPTEFSSEVAGFKYLRNEENLRYSEANNAAAASAAGDLLLFLNNDVFLCPGSVERLIEPMNECDGIGITGGLLLYPDSESIQHAGIHQMLWGCISNYGVGADPGDERFLKQQEIFAVTGAMLCVRRNLFEMVGGFNLAFRYGYEDVDLCLKARSAGFRVMYVPRARGFHCESATLRMNRSMNIFEENYARYRARWNDILIPAEDKYADSLRKMPMRRAVIFGTGRAGAGLFNALNRAGIVTVAFTSTEPVVGESTCHGLPVVPLESVCSLEFDRIIAGSQFFFQVERLLSSSDPTGNALLPLIPFQGKKPD